MIHLVLLLATSGAVSESVIIGDWCAGSKTVFYQEFALEKDEGGRTFHSWLHHRPASSGTWDLSGKTLTIHESGDSTTIYSILSASKTRLVIRQEGEKTRETYVRPGHCVDFPDPSRE